MRVTVYRYNPDCDTTPYLQDYDFEPPQDRDMMILDVLEALKVQDPTLTFRRSCREGVCGSDGMNINGANVLACITRVSTLVQGGRLPSGQRIGSSRSLTIRPLPGLAVIRDLVVDMEPFWNQYKSIKPWLINDHAPPSQERLADVDDPFRVFRCRGVLNCVAYCPKGLNPRNAISHIVGMLVKESV